MPSEFCLRVRGYELDSFGHVNNAVYLNYLEQARWEILKQTKMLTYFAENRLFLAVIEMQIRYAKEVQVFDELVVQSQGKKESPYLVFKQNIYLMPQKKIVTKAKVKTLVLNENRLPFELPDSILYKFIDK